MTLLKMLLTLSLAGSVMALLLFVFKPFLRRRISRRVWYYLWIPVLLRFCLPIGGIVEVFGAEPAMPVEPDTSISNTATVTTVTDVNPTFSTTTAPTTNTTHAVAKPSATTTHAAVLPPIGNDPHSGDTPQWIVKFHPWMGVALWGIGAAIFLCSQLIAYWRLQELLRRHSRPAGENVQAVLAALSGSRPLPRICVCTAVSSPMLMGLFKPCIVLPREDYPSVELQNILLHEVSHLHRGDLFYKWSALLVHTLHWFNPLMWLIRRELDRACEEACDEAVIAPMSEQARKNYGNTLLNMASAHRIAAGLVVTTMATPKKKLRERIVSIMTYRKMSTRAVAFVSVFALVLCLSGCLIDSSTGDPASDNESTSESSDSSDTSQEEEQSDLSDVSLPDDNSSPSDPVDPPEHTAQFSIEEVTAAKDAYNLLVGASSPRRMLISMGFDVDDGYPEEETMFVLTDVNYADYKAKAMEYVTEEVFNTSPYFSEYCQNENGKLKYLDGGSSGYEPVIQQIIPTDHGTYLSREIGDKRWADHVKTQEFAVSEQNGKCVIDFVEESGETDFTDLPIPNAPPENLPVSSDAFTNQYFSNEEVKAALDWYHRAKGVSMCDDLFPLLELNFYAVDTYEDGTTRSNGSYDSFLEALYGHISEEWYALKFSPYFREENGNLVYTNGGRTGVARTTLTINQTEWNTYFATYTLTGPGDEGLVPTGMAEFAVIEQNGQCVIAYYQELGVVYPSIS